MRKRKDAANAPGAEKIDGATGCDFHMLTGKKLERPRVIFPKLECGGIVAKFTPGWNGNGECVGWCITVSHPFADALAAADNALAVAIGDADTQSLWDDLIPTFRRGGECILQLCCSASMIRKFIAQAKRNGFKVVADVPGKAKGGAE